MTIIPEAIPVPLRDDGGGGFRIGNSRVSLDTLLVEQEKGSTFNEILDAYPTLDPADVHVVLAWALRNPQAVADYLRRREEEAERLQAQLEGEGIARTMTQADCDRMQARREARQAHVSPTD